MLAQAVRKWLEGTGGAIVVTDQDHEANSGVWRRLADEGIEVREWQIDPRDGALEPPSLAALLADGMVELVCFPHCSNVIAEINDVAADLRAWPRHAGARTVVDGVSYAPHGFPDIRALGCDVYLFSAYKTYGPHQGIMVIRREASGFELPGRGTFQRRHALQALHAGGAGPCADRGLCGDGRLYRRAGRAARDRRGSGGAEPGRCMT